MEETKYMSKDYTNCMRGIFAILVVIHHLYQYSGLFKGMRVGAIFQILGYVSVAMFFFFSGYGLMLSSQKKDYVDGFFVKRFLPLYCFYVFLIILYSAWTLLLEGSFSLKTFIQSFFFGDTIVTNGWYLQATFVAYLLYWVVFKNIKAPKKQIAVFGACILIYCVLCHLTKMGMSRYQTIPCMVFGMVYYNEKQFMDSLLKRYAFPAFILCGVLFAGCYLLSRINGFNVIMGMLYSVFFVCTMTALSYILCDTSLINNKFNALCGKYSLEIYVTHGLFLGLVQYMKNIPQYIYIYIIVVIIGTALMSVIVKKIYDLIVKFFKKSIQNNIVCFEVEKNSNGRKNK